MPSLFVLQNVLVNPFMTDLNMRMVQQPTQDLFLTASVISSVADSIPLSAKKATLKSLRFTVCRSMRCIGIMAGPFQSRPDMIGSTRMGSSTYRAIRPTWVHGPLAPTLKARISPLRGTRHDVGFIPATPQQWHGNRILP